MRDAIQTLLDELGIQNDDRTSVFDLQLAGVEDKTISLRGRLLDQDQLTALEGAFTDHFPDLSLDTASVQILSRESHERAHVATNLTGLYEKPTFGICLGHQLLALANDIPTFKMHHGHRGLNHPVKNLLTGRCEITTQNHGFGVDPEAVKKAKHIEVTHVNLNDNSIEGIRVKGKQAFSVQYHPESTPGPHDSRYLFDEFIGMMKGK